MQEDSITYDSLTSLLKKKGYFSDQGLNRFSKLLNKTNATETEINAKSIEVSLVAFLLSIKPDEAQVLATNLANQWMTLSMATGYDMIVKEQELRDLYAQQAKEIISFQKRMAMPEVIGRKSIFMPVSPMQSSFLKDRDASGKKSQNGLRQTKSLKRDTFSHQRTNSQGDLKSNAALGVKSQTPVLEKSPIREENIFLRKQNFPNKNGGKKETSISAVKDKKAARYAIIQLTQDQNNKSMEIEQEREKVEDLNRQRTMTTLSQQKSRNSVQGTSKTTASARKSLKMRIGSQTSGRSNRNGDSVKMYEEYRSMQTTASTKQVTQVKKK